VEWNLEYGGGGVWVSERALEVDLPIPDHTTLPRRLKKLGDIGFRLGATDRPIHPESSFHMDVTLS
jgi:hypothetical protein